MALNQFTYAAIDLGSNALRLLIVARNKSNKSKILCRKRWPLRLGDDVFASGELSNEKIKKCVACFQEIIILQKKHQCSHTAAIATSALRDAKNSIQLTGAVRIATGVEIEIISGIREGELIHRAVFDFLQSNKIPIKKQSYNLLMDIGGGSVEFGVAKGTQPIEVKSFPIGSVRVLKKLSADPELALTEMRQKIDSYRDSIALMLKKYSFDDDTLFIGTGGNCDILLSLAQEYFAEGASNFKGLDKNQAHRIYESLVGLSLAERVSKYKINLARADVIVPAGYITLMAMQITQLSQMTVPGVGLGDGLITDMASKLNHV